MSRDGDDDDGPLPLDRPVFDAKSFPMDEVPLFMLQLPTRLPLRGPGAGEQRGGAGAGAASGSGETAGDAQNRVARRMVGEQSAPGGFGDGLSEL